MYWHCMLHAFAITCTACCMPLLYVLHAARLCYNMYCMLHAFAIICTACCMPLSLLQFSSTCMKYLNLLNLSVYTNTTRHDTARHGTTRHDTGAPCYIVLGQNRLVQKDTDLSYRLSRRSRFRYLSGFSSQ